MNFCFTVDDNIRAFRAIAESGAQSLFDHPYFAMLRRLHETFDLKVQLNMFYQWGAFTLADMPDCYKAEFASASDWLKLSFHSKDETRRPYETSGYEEVFSDCAAVQREILRFAGEKSLAKTTTIHFCMLTEEGIRAMKENGVRGLLGLYGTMGAERVSYSICDREKGDMLREGKILAVDGMHHAGIDIVLNNFDADGILSQLPGLKERESLRVMIHEQYFCEDYERYQPDFEEKLYRTFAALKAAGRESKFFEELIG
jgi:hypothetical protein